MSDTPKTAHSHEHLLFKSIETTAKFNKGVSVEWTARKHPSRRDLDNTEYRITVKGPADKAYSLFTLMIQGVTFDVEIKDDKSPGTVVLIDDSNTRRPLGAQPITVVGTAKGTGNHNPNNIWFIEFSGAHCSLIAEARGRPKLGGTAWDPSPVPASTGDVGIMGGHDNVPPGGTTEK